MQEQYAVRQGITEPISIRLSEVDDANVETPVNLASVLEVRVALRQKCGGPVIEYSSTGPRVRVSDASDGVIDFAPESTTFPEPGEYSGWIRLTDLFGITVSFPSDGDFTVIVVPSY